MEVEIEDIAVLLLAGAVTGFLLRLFDGWVSKAETTIKGAAA